MKRLLSLILSLALILTLCAGCRAPSKETSSLQIVATLFPQYDFARQIAGDRAEITLLLPPGMESHSFDPTPADIVTIQKADLFLTTGPSMEPWVSELTDTLSEGTQVVDLSVGIPLSSAEAEDHEHTHTADPHLWTSPKNAKVMVSTILDALCQIDPAGEGVYRESAKAYQAGLDDLDAKFRCIVEEGHHDTMAFSGRFALHYFAKEYGLNTVAALPSCSGESEPSAAAVAEVIDTVRQQGLPVVFYEELSDPKVGRTIAGETGAKLLLFHSCHNLSREEFEGGATYLSLMNQNAEHLKAGLSR